MLWPDRKSTRLNSSHLGISYAVFCLKKKNAPTATAEFRRMRPFRAPVRRSPKAALTSDCDERQGGHPRLSRQPAHRLLSFFLNDRATPQTSPLSLPAALRI